MKFCFLFLCLFCVIFKLKYITLDLISKWSFMRFNLIKIIDKLNSLNHVLWTTTGSSIFGHGSGQLLTFSLLVQSVVVVLLPVLLSSLLLRVQLQLCQSAAELQVQSQPAGPRLARERLPRQEANVRDERWARRGRRGQRWSGRQRAHGARRLRQFERLDPGGLRSDTGASGVSSGPAPPTPATARHHFVLVYGGDGAGGAVASLSAVLQKTLQLGPQVRVGQLGLLQVDVAEAERGGGAEAGGGRQRAAAGRQRAETAARRAGEGAGRQAGDQITSFQWNTLIHLKYHQRSNLTSWAECAASWSVGPSPPALGPVPSSYSEASAWTQNQYRVGFKTLNLSFNKQSLNLKGGSESLILLISLNSSFVYLTETETW